MLVNCISLSRCSTPAPGRVISFCLPGRRSIFPVTTLQEPFSSRDDDVDGDGEDDDEEEFDEVHIFAGLLVQHDPAFLVVLLMLC